MSFTLLEENARKDEKSIHDDILKKAFDQFDYLGIATREYLIEDIIQPQGIVFDDKHYYRLEEIEKYFTAIFGKDVTPLLLERLKRNLNNLLMSIAIVVAPIMLLRLCHSMLGSNTLVR